MKFLEDFTDEQREWFYEDFIYGRRHLKDDKYPDYYYSSGLQDVYSVEDDDIVTLNMFSYSICNNDDDHLWPVIPNENMNGIAITDCGPYKIAFYNESLSEELRDHFGSEAVAISVLNKKDNLDVLVLLEDDLEIEKGQEPEEFYSALALNSYLVLLQRFESKNNF